MDGLKEASDQFRPIYKITIKNPKDGNEYEFNSWYYMIGITKFRSVNKLTIYVDRDLNVPLDMFRIRIATGSGSMRNADRSVINADDIQVGATVKIYLGYASGSEGDLKLDEQKNLVLTGLVDDVSQDLKNIVITGYSNAYKIIFKKPDLAPDEKGKGWSNLDSRAIVTKLLARMVDTDSKHFDKGMEFQYYVPNTKESIYNNIKLMAEYNGFDLYFSKDGKLRFCKKSIESESVKYAEHILDNSIQMTRPPYDEVAVYVCHQVKDSGDLQVWRVTSGPLEGSSKVGNNKVEVLQRQSAIIKNQKQAGEAAKNKLDKLYTPESGQVTILGYPELELGAALSLEFEGAAPGAKALGYMARTDVRITRITHKFNMRSGFVTVLGWIKPPAAKTPSWVGSITKEQQEKNMQISEKIPFGLEAADK